MSQKKTSLAPLTQMSGPTDVRSAWPTVFETAFGSYSRKGSLGEGGAGHVFEVVDAIGNKFALKCLSPAKTNSDKRKRFKNEASFLQRVKHHNIVELVEYGVQEINGAVCPFYLMPLCSGTLRKLIKQKIPVGDVLPIFHQALDGVECAHLMGVFHRDLKPENLLLGSIDPVRVLVADFGIAHFQEDQLATAVETAPTSRMANFTYAAPEQRVVGGKVDLRADIFALGLILNEMFTSQVPHGAKYMKIGEVAKEFEFLDEIVEEMISNQPSNRPSSIQEVKGLINTRSNYYAAQQRLDHVRSQVVAADQPQPFEHIRIESFDWSNGELFLSFNVQPPHGWAERFQRPTAGGWQSVMGSGPEYFKFFGTRAAVRASENSAQQILEHAKNYVKMANAGFAADLQEAANRRRAKEMDQIETQRREAEARSKVLAKLKL